MNVRVEFVTSQSRYCASELPQLTQVCVVGRSNVGKSSFINMLSRQKIAKTSSTPGRTRLINVFRFYFDGDNGKRELLLVDLPGYGYALAPKDTRKTWDIMMQNYLTANPMLSLAVLLADSRHEPSKLDAVMANFLFGSNVSMLIAATKCDKLKKSELIKSRQTIANGFRIGVDNVIMTSAQTALNRDLVLQRLYDLANTPPK